MKLKNWCWIFLLVMGAVLPYANTLVNGFVYDDTSQILENPYIRSFRYLPQIVGSSVVSFTGMPSRYYRPMMTFGYLLCYKLFGFSPAGFHLANIGLNALVVLLVFFVTRRIFGDQILAFGAAVVFALHPIHSESVAWIAAITDLELAFFYLLTFRLFLALNSAEGRRWWLVYFAMMASFALALLSKEQAITLPFLATVYEHFYRQNRAETQWRQKLLRYLPLWLLAVAYIPLRLFALGGFVVASNYWGMTRQELLLAATALTGQYLWKLFWPMNLCAFYVFEKNSRLAEPGVIVGALSAILLCAGFWWLWKRARPLSFGLLWLMATLAPVLNPRWLGVNVFAERYLYLPSVGFCWIMVWGLLAVWKAASSHPVIWRGVLATALCLVALLWSFRIVTRNTVWHDDISLYSQTLEASPKAELIQMNLAAAYQAQGLLQEADRQYRAVLDGDPNCAKCMSDLAWLYIDQGHYAEAKPLVVRAVQLDPKLVSARLNLGLVYQNEGAIKRAEEQFRTAAGIAPGDLYVYTTLASFYRHQGDLSRSEAALKRALSINPYNISSRTALADLYEADHRPAAAIREFEAVLQDEPGNAEAMQALRRLQPPSNQ
jgi:protein O-mannosyl-transferase